MNACQIPVGSRLLIDLPPIRHHGRYLGNGQVVHNSKKNGMVCIETFEAFSGGKAIHWMPPANPIDPARLFAMARSFVGKPYSLFDFNCEHFANLLVEGKSSSKQITAALGGISLGVLIATAKKLSVRQSLLLAGAMGLGSLMLVNSFER